MHWIFVVYQSIYVVQELGSYLISSSVGTLMWGTDGDLLRVEFNVRVFKIEFMYWNQVQPVWISPKRLESCRPGPGGRTRFTVKHKSGTLTSNLQRRRQSGGGCKDTPRYKLASLMLTIWWRVRRLANPSWSICFPRACLGNAMHGPGNNTRPRHLYLPQQHAWRATKDCPPNLLCAAFFCQFECDSIKAET